MEAKRHAPTSRIDQISMEQFFYADNIFLPDLLTKKRM